MKQRTNEEILLVIVQALENVHHPNSTDALREINQQLTASTAKAAKAAAKPAKAK
jgi:hypothetical protein